MLVIWGCGQISVGRKKLTFNNREADLSVIFNLTSRSNFCLSVVRLAAPARTQFWCSLVGEFSNYLPRYHVTWVVDLLTATFCLKTINCERAKFCLSTKKESTHLPPEWKVCRWISLCKLFTATNWMCNKSFSSFAKFKFSASIKVKKGAYLLQVSLSFSICCLLWLGR